MTSSLSPPVVRGTSRSGFVLSGNPSRERDGRMHHGSLVTTTLLSGNKGCVCVVEKERTRKREREVLSGTEYE